MRLRAPLLISAFLLTVLAEGRAEAQSEQPSAAKHLGLGADASLAGLGGVSARYQATKKIGLQGIAAFHRMSNTDEMTTLEVSKMGIFFALRGDFALRRFDDVLLAAVCGLDLLHTTIDLGLSDSSDFRMALEGGVRAEYFVSSDFSIHLETGLVLATMSGLEEASVLGVGSLGGADSPFSRPIMGARDGSNIVLGLGDTTAMAGFTFWLR